VVTAANCCVMEGIQKNRGECEK